MTKYGNKKAILKIDGDSIKFDSKAEAARAVELIGIRDSGFISELIFQPIFILQSGFRRNGKAHIAIKYIADFQYKNKNGNIVVEDVKGVKTTEYKIKRKLFLMKYNDLIFRELYLKRGRFEIKEM